MKKHIKVAFIVTSILTSSMVIAKDNTHSMQGSQNMMGGSGQMQQMMDHRKEMMKSSLNLNKKQEKALNAYFKKKKSLMEDMMGHKKSGMKNTKNMQSGQMSDMHGKKVTQDHHDMKANQQGMMGSQQGMMGGQQGMGGKMGALSGMSFIERMNFMEKHAKKMQATSKAGKKFYKTLSSEQKKKLADMPKNMGGMGTNNMKKNNMNMNQKR